MSNAPTGSEAPTYVDASAFVKLVVAEPESEALRRFLTAAPRRLTSSALLEVEAARAARIVGGDAAVGIADELTAVDLVDVTAAIRGRARSLDPVQLRALDAIHLATALEAGVRDVLVYDHRLASAAAAYGLNVLAPGT